jgi:hypothetical protein
VSGVDELVAFLTRCLDEDERVVRQMMAEPGGFYLEAETDSVNIMTVGAYVYRWPPKRVLAEVEAKQERLLWIEGELADDDTQETVQWLAKLEAQPYAGQDGWREEWAL